MSRELEEIRDGWEHAAQTDPLFNILTLPGKANGNWDVDEFFLQGEIELQEVFMRLDTLGLRPAAWDRALDFGCGVGRISQALASRFSRVDGVDVSETMVKLAKRYARDRGINKCRFQVNQRADLKLFKARSFDFVYSIITLQHLPSDLQERYVREFYRVVNPDGLVVFQLSEGPEMHHPEGEWLSMYGTPQGTVIEWVEDAGGMVLTVDESAASGGEWTGWRYIGRRS